MLSNLNWCCRCGRECLIFGLLAFAYFVIFPQDLTDLLAPLKNILGMSYAVSPWLYMVAAVAIVAWTVIRVWGPRTA